MTSPTKTPPLGQLSWTFRGQTWKLGDFPKLMGIVNVTPDSFSDGGQFLDLNRAIDQCLRLVEDGADLLDIGGESTRPGSASVSEAEEIGRVESVIAKVARRVSVPISIDTTKAAVAQHLHVGFCPAVCGVLATRTGSGVGRAKSLVRRLCITAILFDGRPAWTYR